MSNPIISKDERRTLVEILETTIPFRQKVVALMGRDNYIKFMKIREAWKRRVMKYYTNIENFDGKYIAIYIENMFAIIEEYHELANARYGEIIKNHPEMITRMSAGTQSLLLNQIIDESIEIKEVEYLEISESTVFDAKSKALEIFTTGQSWKPKGDEARGPIFISMVYFMLETLAFAMEYFKKTLFYHSKRHLNPKKYPVYWEQFTAYILEFGFTAKPLHYISTDAFSGELTKDILTYLQYFYPESIHYQKVSEALGAEIGTVSKLLSDLVQKEQVVRTKRGYYQFKGISSDLEPIEEKKKDVSNSP